VMKKQRTSKERVDGKSGSLYVARKFVSELEYLPSRDNEGPART
jgi:hypothetical protein